MKEYKVGPLTAQVTRFGDGFIITVGGGDIHLGAVSFSEPYHSHGKESSSVSTLTRYSHRDDSLSAPLARELASSLGAPVIVIAGYHQDSITEEEIIEIKNDNKKLAELLKKELLKL